MIKKGLNLKMSDLHTFPIKRFWHSIAEQRSYNILLDFLNFKDYRLIPHVHLKDIFISDEKQEWSDYHIDFLVIDKWNGNPVLGIEINGIKHYNNKEYRDRDYQKRILFTSNDIPLIFVPLGELPNFSDKEYKENYDIELAKLLKKVLLPYTLFPMYPNYCRCCNKPAIPLYKKDHSASFCACPEHGTFTPSRLFNFPQN